MGDLAVTSPINPAPVTEWRDHYLPAYLSNGLIGLRVGHLPPLYGVTMLSGFEGIDPEAKVEAFARAPYPLAGDLRIGSAALSDPGRAVLREQRYDFSCAELHTRIAFDAGDVRADVDIVSLCSRTQLTIALQEVRVRVDRDCELTMSSSIDVTDVPGRWAHDEPASVDAPADWLEGPYHWRSLGDLSGCGLARATDLLGADSFERTSSRVAPEKLATSYTFQARAGREYRLRLTASLVPEMLHSQPHMQAARMLQEAQLRGFDEMREDNRRAWQEIWRCRPTLVGATPRWQAFADAAFFYLATSVHASSPSATSVFGLAYWPNYHYYRGHMMWDLETFAVPPLLLTLPTAALGMLRFRHTRLIAASANATMTGYLGAEFPWESSLIRGHEASPLGALGAATEHHVSMDVAIAFARFLHALGPDTGLSEEMAMQVLQGVADWIESRVERTARGYEMHGVIGIGETGRTVDNSAFTNMAAAVALRETIALARRMNAPYRPCWETIADEMVIPTDPNSRVILNHDGYVPTEEQGATPEAAAGLFPLEYQVDRETERETLRFYLGLADRYAGQPMLSAMLGVYAARLGDRAACLDMFEKGYGQFVIDPYTITAEYAPALFPQQPVAGPFTANLAGFLTSCFYGLTGLRLHGGDPQTWFERPIVLPEGWEEIQVNDVWVRDQRMSLCARHGDERGHLIPHEGEPRCY
jgi:hypothetical protein